MNFDDHFFIHTAAKADAACRAMRRLEGGAIANPDENRMVGHYWLRNPALAPTVELRSAIEKMQVAVADFAADIHSGKIASLSGKLFTDVLVIGIGGSALGPQLASESLGSATDKMRLHFFDNTDPDGMAKVLAHLGARLSTTLVVVISKSGGTKETRNGMLVAQQAIPLPKHFVAITGEGSELDKTAVSQGWLARFPMWDWVGGRTSVMSAVGLLPMALQGLDIEAYLAGAAAMDAKTRTDDISKNAAMVLALSWFYAGEGVGQRDMVVLPYKDSLLLFSRYLQQLIMESIGKEFDLNGNRVEQGIAVYGNKGSTDQHAYIQQLRDGLNNFFATFIEVRRSAPSLEVEENVTSADYLQGFLRGTRKALYENNRESLTISIETFDAHSLGMLVALYERAVGFYASLINVNAYHQPGVEAGKKAAEAVLALQKKVHAFLQERRGVALTADEIATALEADPEDVFHVAMHLATNREGIAHTAGRSPADDSFLFFPSL